MIRIISNKSCLNCRIVKETLKKKGIAFTEELIDSLSQEEQDKLMDMASQKRLLKMPLILKQGELTTLNELLGGLE